MGPRSAARRDGGASLVEFALVLPLLILLIAGMLDFGLFFNTQIQLSNAAQEGARMASLGKPLGSRTSNGDDIWTRAKNGAPGVSPASMTVQRNQACPTNPTPTQVGQVTVTVTDFDWLLLQDALGVFGRAGVLPNPTASAQIKCA